MVSLPTLKLVDAPKYIARLCDSRLLEHALRDCRIANGVRFHLCHG